MFSEYHLATCNQCDEVINGKRFKCKTCDSNNLCEDCYSETGHIHEFVAISFKEVELLDSMGFKDQETIAKGKNLIDFLCYVIFQCSGVPLSTVGLQGA